jgi:hypothetical protein
MRHCSGACDQGRKKCVTPVACERPEDDYNDRKEWVIMIPIMIFLIACCCYFIWTMLGP